MSNVTWWRKGKPGGDADAVQPGGAAPRNSAVLGGEGQVLSRLFPAGLDDWAPGKIGATLDRLFSHTVGVAQRRIEWYDKSGSRMGRRSRRLRFWAIACGTVGTLYPLVGAAWAPPRAAADWLGFGGDASYLGYVLLAVAAALVAADNAFGVSSSWMRFRATQVEMERLLAGFRYDWILAVARLDGQPPDAGQRGELLRLHRVFAGAIDAAAQRETAGWMQEFRGALADLVSTYRSPVDTRRPNVADAQVTNVINAVGPVAPANGAAGVAAPGVLDGSAVRPQPSAPAGPVGGTAGLAPDADGRRERAG